ncbi:polycystin-2-like [Convolutriloba macropyga]|uniref:polycystin-2-like n=1 Tax=Convolutriloba macropyga TaxID=536237 RepID=UPI003F51FD0F
MYVSLIPGLYSQQWYNGNVTNDIRGFTSDKQSYLVGAARIRQVRMDPLAHCDAPKIIRETVNDCYPDYSLGDGDTAGYNEGWVLNSSINTDEFYLDEKENPVGSRPWVYVPQMQADGIPIIGDLNMYGPGGYIMTLNTNMEKAIEDVENLQAHSWVDTMTRAVIIEFTVFNPNVNLFSVVSLVIEFSAQGDGYPFEQMKTLRLYPYMSSAGYLVLVCQLAYLAFLIYYMYVEAKEVKQLKWGYLKQFWNWVEIIIIILSWVSFGLIISYVVGVEVTMNQIKEFSNTRFISFGGPATVNETYKIVSAITCYFGYIKLMHMLRFNKKMSSFACVLKVASNDITNFLIMFTVVFIAFAQFAYLVLGSVVSGYKSFVTTSTTLMAMLLGQWDFYEVEEADRLLGPGFLFTYIIAANLILLNVFLSIICEACDQVNGEVAQQENDFEVVDFMVGQVKMLIGTSRLTQNAAKKMEEDQEKDQEELEEQKKAIDIDSVSSLTIFN